MYFQRGCLGCLLPLAKERKKGNLRKKKRKEGMEEQNRRKGT
jgi:hypothetical protein